MNQGNEQTELSVEEQLERVQEQLANAQKLTALGELVSTTTHEFNNVLMTILNYAKMGLRHRDDATRTKALERILAAGERASKITNSVLGVARNRADRFEPTQLADIVRDIMVLMEREFNKYRIRVENTLSDVPMVMANGNQLQQVILNLLINARQAMPGGGIVQVRLGHDAEDGTVDLTIRDNGAGIPAEKLPRIFDPFFTTKQGPDESGKGGTGLGLSACRDIVETHRGRIRVESTEGVGTAFTIRLPVARTVTSPAALPTGTVTPSNTPSSP